MIQCKICNDNSRTKNQALDHYERFHKPPIQLKDGTIQINAVHQVTLVLKDGKTWDQLLNDENKRSRKFKRVDESALRSIEQLRTFEKKNNIEFGYAKENTFFVERNTSLLNN